MKKSDVNEARKVRRFAYSPHSGLAESEGGSVILYEDYVTLETHFRDLESKLTTALKLIARIEKKNSSVK